MKKILLLLIFSFSIGVANAQLSNEQFTVITKVSADWCPNCGNWGWTAFENMRTSLEDKNVYFIMAHHTGGLANDASVAWTDNLDNVYQPEFYLNNDYQNMNNNNAPTVTESMGDQIDLLAELGAFAGVEGEAYVVSGDSKLFHSVDVEFFTEQNGEYFVGAYVIQNNIIANQASQGEVLQPQLLTAAFGDNWYGVPLSNTTGIQTFEMSIEQPDQFSAAPQETEILTVIWNRLADGTFIMFNAHMDDEVSFVTNTVEIENPLSGFDSNIDEGVLNINLETALNRDALTVELIDITGKTIQSKNFVTGVKGQQNFSMNVADLRTGMYIVRLESEGLLSSKKVYSH